MFYFFFFNTYSYSAELNVQKLIELGYPKTFFYKDNYKKSNVKWFNLSEIIEQKPKFIALVEQNLKLNGEFIDYKFVYSSKHNFFKLVTTEVKNKKSPFGSISLIKKRISKPEDISDENISKDEFLENVLDHCKYSPVKNIKKPDTKKRIIFKEFNECKIKYLNAKKIDNLTLKKFIEIGKNNKDLKNEDTNEKVSNENKKNDPKKKTSETTGVENEIKQIDKEISVAFSWQNFPKPIISNLKMSSKNTGIIDIYIHETKEKCVGTIALNSDNNGNWSLSCPNNDDRPGVFKKGMGGSGTLIKENNFILGKGLDIYKNEINFIAKLD